MDIIPSTATKSLTSETTFSSYLLIFDSYSKIPKRYGMEKITTEEVMDKLDMLQSRFWEIDEFGCWNLEKISADADTQFTLTEFKEECQTYVSHLTLLAPENQESNRQVEVTKRTLRTISHSLMVHALISESYIHFSFMYTKDHIFTVLPIKDMINEYVKHTTPSELATCTKPSVSHFRVLFCPCDVQKGIAHVNKKELNMCHQ